MPVRDIKPSFFEEHTELVRLLAAEWSNPNPSAAEPVIGIERGLDGLPAHVYVVWSKWEYVDRVERSEIVMEAATIALSPEEVNNITIAMGLTPEEAPSMGIQV